MTETLSGSGTPARRFASVPGSTVDALRPRGEKIRAQKLTNAPEAPANRIAGSPA